MDFQRSNAKKVPISSVVHVATRSMLQTLDWGMTLTLVDAINRGPQEAKEAVKALRKRLHEKNVSVQMLTLTVLDTCMKNCGDSFHHQVASREILSDMVKLALSKKSDNNVRVKVLSLVDTWQLVFGGPTGKYPQFFHAYDKLWRKNVQFPQRQLEAINSYLNVQGPSDVVPAGSSRMSSLPNGWSANLNGHIRHQQSFRGVHAQGGDLPLTERLDIFGNMVKVLSEFSKGLLETLDSPDTSRSQEEGDIEAMEDLIQQCQQESKWVQEAIQATSDQDLLWRALCLNDKMQEVLGKHEAIVRRLGSGESGSRCAARKLESLDDPNTEAGNSPSPRSDYSSMSGGEYSIGASSFMSRRQPRASTSQGRDVGATPGTYDRRSESSNGQKSGSHWWTWRRKGSSKDDKGKGKGWGRLFGSASGGDGHSNDLQEQVTTPARDNVTRMELRAEKRSTDDADAMDSASLAGRKGRRGRRHIFSRAANRSLFGYASDTGDGYDRNRFDRGDFSDRGETSDRGEISDRGDGSDRGEGSDLGEASDRDDFDQHSLLRSRLVDRMKRTSLRNSDFDSSVTGAMSIPNRKEINGTGRRRGRRSMSEWDVPPLIDFSPARPTLAEPVTSGFSEWQLGAEVKLEKQEAEAMPSSGMPDDVRRGQMGEAIGSMANVVGKGMLEPRVVDGTPEPLPGGVVVDVKSAAINETSWPETAEKSYTDDYSNRREDMTGTGSREGYDTQVGQGEVRQEDEMPMIDENASSSVEAESGSVTAAIPVGLTQRLGTEPESATVLRHMPSPVLGGNGEDDSCEEENTGFSVLRKGVIGAYDRAEMGVGPEINGRLKMEGGGNDLVSGLDTERRDEDKEFDRDEDGWTEAWENVNEDMREDMSEGLQEELRMAMQQLKLNTVGAGSSDHCDEKENNGEGEKDESVGSKEEWRDYKKSPFDKLSSRESEEVLFNQFEEKPEVMDKDDRVKEDTNDALAGKQEDLKAQEVSCPELHRSGDQKMDEQTKDVTGMRSEDRGSEPTEHPSDWNLMDTGLLKPNDPYWGSIGDVGREVDDSVTQKLEEAASGSISSAHAEDVQVSGELVLGIMQEKYMARQLREANAGQERDIEEAELEKELEMMNESEGGEHSSHVDDSVSMADRDSQKYLEPLECLRKEHLLSDGTDQGSGGGTLLEAAEELPVLVAEKWEAMETEVNESEDQMDAGAQSEHEAERWSSPDVGPTVEFSPAATRETVDALSSRDLEDGKREISGTPKSQASTVENSSHPDVSPSMTSGSGAGSARRSSLGDWWLKQTSPGVTSLSPAKSDEVSTPKPLSIAGWTVWGSLTRPRSHRQSSVTESPNYQAGDKESPVSVSSGPQQSAWVGEAKPDLKGTASPPEDSRSSPISDTEAVKTNDAEGLEHKNVKTDLKTVSAGGEATQAASHTIAKVHIIAAEEAGRDKDEEPVSMGMKEGLSSLFRWGDSFVQKRFGRKTSQASNHSVPQDEVEATGKQSGFVGLSPSSKKEDMSAQDTRDVQSEVVTEDEVEMEKQKKSRPHILEHMEEEVCRMGEGVVLREEMAQSVTEGDEVHRQVGTVCQQTEAKHFVSSEDSVGTNKTAKAGEEPQCGDDDVWRCLADEKGKLTHKEMVTSIDEDTNETDKSIVCDQGIGMMDEKHESSINEEAAGSDKDSSLSEEEGNWRTDRSSEASTDEESQGPDTDPRALIPDEIGTTENFIGASNNGNGRIGMSVMSSDIEEWVADIEKELTQLEMVQQNAKMEVEMMGAVNQIKVTDAHNQKGHTEEEGITEKSLPREELDSKQQLTSADRPVINKEEDGFCGSSTQSLETAPKGILLQEQDASVQKSSSFEPDPIAMSSAPTVSLVSLPGEPLLSILGLLSDQDLCHISATCRTLQNLGQTVWMRKCQQWANEIDLQLWRSHMDSNMALYRFLRTCSALIGGWTYGTYSYGLGDRVDLIMVVWGFMSVVACSFSQPIVRRKSSLEWRPMFEIVSDYDGSCNVFYFGRTEGRPLMFPGVVSLAPSQYPNKMRIRPRPCKGYSSGGRPIRRVWSGDERKRRVSASMISRRDRFRVLLMEAKRLTTWVQQNASSISSVWGKEWRSQLRTSMKPAPESPCSVVRPSLGWSLGTGGKAFSGPVEEVSETPLSGPGSEEEMAKWAFPRVGLETDRFFGNEREKRLDIIRQLIAVRKVQMPGWDTGEGLENNGAALQFMLQTSSSEWQLDHTELFYPDRYEYEPDYEGPFCFRRLRDKPNPDEELAGLWMGRYHPFILENESKEDAERRMKYGPKILGDGLAVLFLRYEQTLEEVENGCRITGYQIIGLPSIPFGSAVFRVTAEGVDGPEAAYLHEQDASPHQIVRMYEGDGITQQGYGFRYHRYVPGRLFRQRNGGVFFSWDQSQALLQLKRLDVADLMKESSMGDPDDITLDASHDELPLGLRWIF